MEKMEKEEKLRPSGSDSIPMEKMEKEEKLRPSVRVRQKGLISAREGGGGG